MTIMKNEGLIHHRQTELLNSKKSTGVGFLVFLLSIQVFAAAGWVLFFLCRRWGITAIKPEWWELSLCSMVFIFLQLWMRAAVVRRDD